MQQPARHIVPTADGSHTVEVQGSELTYHSRHGALQESVHVFIQAGLHEALQRFNHGVLHVFELGFGTGLNAFLTALEADQLRRRIDYTTIEPFPLTPEEAAALNYPERLGYPELFRELHACDWETRVPVTEQFYLHKVKADLLRYELPEAIHLVYFDAFAPAAQPELWTESIFRRLHGAMLPGGMLVTYCSKSDVRRAMQTAGFAVEKLPGPPGKREMLRAVKG